MSKENLRLIGPWNKSNDDGYPGRNRIVNQIHQRGAFPLGPLVRGTALTYIFPSFEDQFRDALAKLITAQNNKNKTNIINQDTNTQSHNIICNAIRDIVSENEKVKETATSNVSTALKKINESHKKNNTDSHWGHDAKEASKQLKRLHFLCVNSGGRVFDPATGEKFKLNGKKVFPDIHYQKRRIWSYWKKNVLGSIFNIEWEIYSHNQNYRFFEHFPDHACDGAPDISKLETLTPGHSTAGVIGARRHK